MTISSSPDNTPSPDASRAPSTLKLLDIKKWWEEKKETGTLIDMTDALRHAQQAVMDRRGPENGGIAETEMDALDPEGTRIRYQKERESAQ